MKIVVVNATALKTGGGLTILKEFISNIPESNHQVRYYIFTSISDSSIFKINSQHVEIIDCNINTWRGRLAWDYCGLAKWCRDKKIKPNLLISLQNTGVNLDRSIPQIIYYHQPLPLFDYKCNPLIKRQRLLWFYKKVYPYCVKIFNRNSTKFIVQLNCMKQRLNSKLGISLENIHVFRPTVARIDVSQVSLTSLAGRFNILYPASAMVYKNHIQIAKAFAYLKYQKHNIDNIQVYFAGITQANLPDVAKYISENNLQDNFIFLGQSTYEELLSLYKSCNLVVFPSYVETFGLPLIEAANFGKKIIAADEDYAREVLTNYPGVEFAITDNAQDWAEKILKSYNGPSSYAEFAENSNTESWSQCFKFINNLIGVN